MQIFGGSSSNSEASADALSEALVRKLLPAIRSVVEEAVASAMVRALDKAGKGPGQQAATFSSTSLGSLQQGMEVSVSWNLSNTGMETWAPGAQLRFLKGRLAPPATFSQSSTQVPTPSGGSVSVEATMAAPAEPGPADSVWQLQASDGTPLSPPLHVDAMVMAGRGSANASSGRSPRAASRSMPQAQPQYPALPAGSAPVPVGPRSAQQGAPSSDPWMRAFEEFVGRDTLARLREQGNPEQQKSLIMNKVWEHVKSRAPSSKMDFIAFDPVLQNLFAPVLQPGVTGCPGRDLPIISKQLLHHYQSQVARRG